MKSDWTLDNIQIPPVKLHTELNKDTGILKLQTAVMGIITEEIAELNSQAIRDALIAMGWTPPETGEAIAKVMDEMDRDPRAYSRGYWLQKLNDAINETDPASD